jgi:hypothetical protein
MRGALEFVCLIWSREANDTKWTYSGAVDGSYCALAILRCCPTPLDVLSRTDPNDPRIQGDN